MVRQRTLTPSFQVRILVPLLVHWSEINERLKKGIINESKDVAWIKQRYHSKSILQDFGYMTTLTEIIPYADIAQWRER